MSSKANSTVATMGIDIGKNCFHVVGLDQRGAIVVRQRWTRGQVEARLANSCLGPGPTAPRLGSSYRPLHRCKSQCLHRC